MTTSTGYFLCMDILGFSEIIKNLSHDTLQPKIEEWISLVNSCANESKIDSCQVFSDTIFAATGSELHDLEKLICFCQKLLNESLKLSFPLRGAISHGKYTWEKSIYGQAVLKAHELEKKQNWIGVTLDTNIPKTPKYRTDYLVCYAVPLQKNDLIMLYSAICWDIPDFDTLSSYLTSGGLGGVPGVGKPLTWDWAEKISNTILFKNYVKVIKSTGNDPSKFHGNIPIHFVDLSFTK